MGQEKSLPINTNPYDYCDQQKLKSKSLSGSEYSSSKSNKLSQQISKSAPNHHHHSNFRSDFQSYKLEKYRNYQSSHKKAKSYSSANHFERPLPPPPPPSCSIVSKSSSGYSSSYCPSSSSSKSIVKQKNYLNHQLYIKSYLDILEEDIKAKEEFKPAPPGIRNYKPKIYNTDSLKQKIKKEPELWI